MKTLYQETKEYINKYDLSLTKKWGQNFLVDDFVLQKIIKAGDFTNEDFVVEIGAGIGTLTKALAKKVKYVDTWEIDERFLAPLDERLNGLENYTIHHEDFLQADISFLENKLENKLEKRVEKSKIKVCGNLPYYITSPIIMKCLESGLSIDFLLIMVQKEVGDRMKALPDTKAYSAFSAILSYYGSIEEVAKVPVNSFIPRPQVTSSVIKMKVFEKPPVDVVDEKLLFSIIHASFAMRRKTILNCLSQDVTLDITKERTAVWLENANIDPQRRGETLTLNEFAKLANTYKI